MTQTYKVQVSMNQAHLVESGFVWKQGDFGFNLEIEVLDFDTTGVTPQIVFRKSAGAVEATQITQSSNKFTYVIRGTELDTPGPCICDLKLKDSTTKRVSTASFKYFVLPDTLDGLAEEADSYSDTVEQLLQNTIQKSQTAGLVKNDGTINTTIENEVSNLKKLEGQVGYRFNYDESALKYGYTEFVTDDWEIGYIYNGGNIARTYAIRTLTPKALPTNIVGVNLASNIYRLGVYQYSSAGVYESYDNYNTSSFEITLDQSKLYRLAISFKSGEGEIDLNTALNTVLIFDSSKTWNVFEKITDHQSDMASMELQMKAVKRDSDYKQLAMAYGYNKRIADNWEIGYLLNGNNLARDYAIRTHEPKQYPEKVRVINNIGNALVIIFWKYQSDGTYVSSSSGYKNSDFIYECDSDYLYRITVSQGDGQIDYNDTLDKVLFMDYSDTKEFDGFEVSFNNHYPKFYHTSSVVTTVYFESGTVMRVNSAKRRIVKNYSFSSDTTYSLGNNDYLMYDVGNNTISIETQNIANNANKIIIAHFEYNTISDCAIIPYFALWYADSLKESDLPYYYNTYMSDKIDSVREAFRDLGTNGDAFGFISDTHWNANTKKAPAMLKMIAEKTQLDKVFHGGDIVPAYGTEELMYSCAYGDDNAFRKSIGDILYRVPGNHDIHITDNSSGNYYELTAAETYGALLAKQSNKVHYDKNNISGMYFYIDNELKNIRYIFVNNFENPNTAYMSVTQQEWIKARLLEVKDNWTVVVIGHAPIISEQNDDYAAYENFVSLLERFANHTDVFANATSLLAGYISGHRHEDMFKKQNNINFIVTTCDALYQTDGYNRAANTTNEQAFDIFFLDTTNRTLNTVRVGAGSDRSFTY